MSLHPPDTPALTVRISVTLNCAARALQAFTCGHREPCSAQGVVCARRRGLTYPSQRQHVLAGSPLFMMGYVELNKTLTHVLREQGSV